MSIILKGGTIVTSEVMYDADIKIDNQKIESISSNIDVEKNYTVIDAKGCFIIPGGIDVHTHFDMDCGTTKTSDDFYTGTKAAIVGGTTSIIDFAESSEGENLIEAFKTYYKKADKKSFCDYSFHMTITNLDENTKNHMKILAENGITSFKLYMAYKDSLQVDDNIIFNILSESKKLGCRVLVHCENGDLLEALTKEYKDNNKLLPRYHPHTRPNILEKEAISRLIDICKLTKSNIYIVHLSTKEGLEEIKKARKYGINIYAETCPQYLCLDKSKYENDSFEVSKFVLSPPLRGKEDILSLWNGIKESDIDIISTDHCSFNYKEQKEIGKNDFTKIPNGIPGVEHRIPLMYTYGVRQDKISLNKFVEITSTNPAKTFGMYPKKGEIRVGSDADLVVINPNKEYEITSNNQTQDVDYTPYEGVKIGCSIDHVLVRGNHIVQDGKFKDSFPNGEFIKRQKIN